jgi:hypothetical protein
MPNSVSTECPKLTIGPVNAPQSAAGTATETHPANAVGPPGEVSTAPAMQPPTKPPTKPSPAAVFKLPGIAAFSAVTPSTN